MNREIIECDICHKEITTARDRYKFERYKNYFAYPNQVVEEKFDMCEKCFTKLLYFCLRDGEINDKANND